MATSTERSRRLRARRAASLLPADDRPPLPAEDQLAASLAETLEALQLGPEHAGAVQLARKFARALDEAGDPAWAARWLGPELLKTLTQLGATPVAKAALTKGAKAAEQGPSQLDRLRAARSTSDRGRGRL